MAADYKSLKEDFVSNLTGGSIKEINYVTAVAPVAAIVWSVLQTRQSFFTPYLPLASAVDVLLNVGCILLATTLYSSSPVLLNALLLAPAALLYAVPKTAKSTQKKKSQKSFNVNPAKTRPVTLTGALDDLPKKSFLTTYRGCMLVITCLAILAVDFRIFPRRFAKVENWGTSLMDIGVGSFVFSAGVVAARPILKEKRHIQSQKFERQGSRTEDAPTGVGLSKRLSASLSHSIPLFVLGLVRLWSVKGLDYAEHVSEYGVHWNFFFTLAFLPPFVAVFQSAFSLIPSYALLAVLLGSVYEVALDFTDLKAFILTAPRTDLFSQNREGIFSFFGYLAIFLAGQHTGMFVIPRRVLRDDSVGPGAQRKRLLLTLIAWSSFWIALYLLSSQYVVGLGISISRRLANLPYFLWVSAFNSTQITAFCFIETIFFPSLHKSVDLESEHATYVRATSRILIAFNRNGLAIFLLANLLTGLVNLTIPTLEVGNSTAMAVLAAYALVVSSIALALDHLDVNIKL